MVGQLIQHYEIVSLVGEGGMGNVYLAQHTQLDRQVAIKMLHPRFASNESLRKRFQNEAAAMAHLQHPNIVSLHDYVESDNGLFLIMEYVDGIELDKHIREVSGPIEEKKALQIMDQILDAFDYAHKQGVVHRDIKPSNILMTPDGTVKVLDFGIAKLLDNDKSMTKTGTQMGTVLYMSPEQVKGEKVDHRTDIYSLGVSLFQIVTGVSPYANDSTEFEVYTKIVQEPLPNASSYYPGVTAGIEAIISKATQKDKDSRFQSCNEMKTALVDPTSVKVPVAKSTVHSYAELPRLKILQNMYIRFRSSRAIQVSPRLSVSKIMNYLKYSFGMSTNDFIQKYGKIQMLFDFSRWGNGKGGMLFSTEVIAIVLPGTRKRLARKWADIVDLEMSLHQRGGTQVEFKIICSDPDKSRKIFISDLNSGKIADLTSIVKAFKAAAEKRGLSGLSTSPSHENTVASPDLKTATAPIPSIDYTQVNRLNILQQMQFQYDWRCFVSPEIPKGLLHNYCAYNLDSTYDDFVKKYGTFELLIDLSKHTNGKGGIIMTSNVLVFYEPDTKVKLAAILWENLKYVSASYINNSKTDVSIELHRKDNTEIKNLSFNGLDPQVAHDIVQVFKNISKA